MINFINKKVIFYFLITLLIFTLDRISKIYVINIAENYGEVDIYLNQFINIILVWNTGIGFGLLSFEKQFLYNLITLIIVLVNFVILYLGIKLNNLVGQRLQIGSVELEVIDLCRPCRHLTEILNQRSVLKEFLRKGGLRCQIISSSNINVGDEISVLK